MRLCLQQIYRMVYVKYAESQNWRTEMLSLNENGIGGFKEVTFMINGQGLIQAEI